MRKLAAALIAAGVIVVAAALALREPDDAPPAAPTGVAPVVGEPTAPRVHVPTTRTGAAQLTGRVRAANGEPVAKAPVEVIFADRPSLPPSCAGLVDGCLCGDDLAEAIDELERAFQPLAEVVTEADGTFRVSGLPQARLEVRAHSDTKYGGVVIALDGRAANVELTVDRQPSAAISVVGERGEAVTAYLIASEGGRFLDFAVVKPGRANRMLAPGKTVRAVAPGYAIGVVGEGWGGDDGVPIARVSLTRGVRLTGVVPDAGAGAPVRASGLMGCATGVTAADGTWTLPPMARGPYQVMARAGGLIAEVPVDTHRLDGGVELPLGSEVTLRITCVDDRKQPVVGAPIEVMRFPLAGGSGVPTRATTGPDGTLVHRSVPGDFIVKAEASGKMPASSRGKVEAGEWAVTLQLSEPAQVRGRLVAADGTGLVKPRLTVHTMDRARFFTQMPQPKVEPSGAFTVTTVAGQVQLHGSAEGMMPAQVTVEAPAEGVEIRLERGGAIEGTVVDDRGAPVKGADVSAHVGGDPGTRGSALSDAEGAFTLTPLADEVYEVWAQVERKRAGPPKMGPYTPVIERFGKVRAELKGGRASPVVIRLGPVRAATGRVVDEAGRPVAGVGVAVRRGEPARIPSAVDVPYVVKRMTITGMMFFPMQQFTPVTTSAADGSFTLDGLADDTHVLQGRAPGLREDAEKAVTIRPGAEGVVLVVRPIHHLIVPVRTEDGAPLTKASVGGEELPVADGAVRAEILFTHTGPVPISAPGYAQVARPVSINPSADTTLAPVVLAKGRTLALVVTDLRSGKPLDAWIVVDGDHWTPRGARENEYTVPTGAFPARVGAHAHLEAQVTVAADQTQLALALDPGAIISGAATDAAGQPLKGHAHAPVAEIGGKKVWGQLDRPGGYAIRGVPAGAAKVWLQRQADQKAGPAKTVEVPASGTVTVPLTAP